MNLRPIKAENFSLHRILQIYQIKEAEMVRRAEGRDNFSPVTLLSNAGHGILIL
jgi:hypothetical protein